MVIKRSNGISTICMICYFLLKLLVHKNLGSFHFSKTFAKKRRNLEQQEQQQQEQQQTQPQPQQQQQQPQPQPQPQH